MGSGQFVYRINLDPTLGAPPRYNMLRHAGAIYALAGYLHVHADPEARDALLRAATFLKREAIAPLPGRDDILAVWSYPRTTRVMAPVQAKLGGTGLGLVALLSVEEFEPEFTPLKDLRRLGRFLVYMQKEDGSFTCKYVPSEGGKSDRWTSLYYPGEAALGLVMLYQKDPAPLWLDTAAKAIGHLARVRRQQTEVEADHWALLATAELLEVYDRSEQPVPRELLISHAVQICESILANKPDWPDDALEHGCLTADGRTCPTSTRLEGLLAALRFLPEEHEELRDRIAAAVEEGIALLVRTQVQNGDYVGGIPRTVFAPATGDPPSYEHLPPDATEVRIDYVQHALSAMLGYRDQLGRSGAFY